MAPADELHVALVNAEVTGVTPEEEAEWTEKFYRTLENAQPDQVMAAMIHPRSAKLVSTLPETVFVEALCLLSPAHFIEPYRDLHHALHPWSTLLAGIKRLENRFDEFTHNLLTIREYRIDGPYAMGLAEYTHLLACAASMGNEALTHKIWHCIFHEGLVPNAACAEYFTEGLVWSHCYDGAPAYRLRPLERHLRNRSFSQWSSWHARVRGPEWAGFGAGRYDVLRFVETMVNGRHRLGQPPDERMYVSLMIAAARMGKTDGIHGVLKTAWNVDVEALKSGELERRPVAVPMERSSALYPGQRLLFGIAHALGTNGDIFGQPRTRGRDKEAASVGQVSSELVRIIFTTMTEEPYNVVPNMLAWRFMMKISMTDGTLDEFKGYAQEAYDLLRRTRARQAEAYELIIRCLQPSLGAAVRQIKREGHDIRTARKHGVLHHTDHFDSPHLSDAISAYEIIRLEVYQQEYLLKRTIFNALQVREWAGTPDEQWYYQERPKMMQEWKDFLPEKIVLTTPDGNKNAPIKRYRNDKNLFAPADTPQLREEVKWDELLAAYPFLDDKKTAPCLRRVFRFRKEPSEKLKKHLLRLRTSSVEYPPDNPLSSKNNPSGELFGRLAALGMLKSPKHSVYRLDDDSLI
ncbi:hypothetical protein N7468_001552 [Penicillium chermesinum]|uniref:Uncharacterized protein n=1 Tax=Penicillium chermesinum TaxID=63820 RepID=A0A9W9PH13_9EURO|nr:uncharacterized protein N7468_001552 [Penicillium chermesinum]KAJ5246569.1 hypothetical protein N7468_001552 [Penicillium chermesinum]